MRTRRHRQVVAGDVDRLPLKRVREVLALVHLLIGRDGERIGGERNRVDRARIDRRGRIVDGDHAGGAVAHPEFARVVRQYDAFAGIRDGGRSGGRGRDHLVRASRARQAADAEPSDHCDPSRETHRAHLGSHGRDSSPILIYEWP
jgi:hypothetical protein